MVILRGSGDREHVLDFIIKQHHQGYFAGTKLLLAQYFTLQQQQGERVFATVYKGLKNNHLPQFFYLVSFYLRTVFFYS